MWSPQDAAAPSPACCPSFLLPLMKTQVMEGEDKIVESMRRFANDAKCVEYLKTFKEAEQRS